MGKELYEGNSRFRLWMDHCAEIVSSRVELSLIDVLYRGGRKIDPFDRILHTNPALLAIEYSLARLLMEMGIKPSFLLGYSLGEFTAAVVSGAISLEDGLGLIIDYAQLIEREGSPAGMLAVIGSEDVMRESPDVFSRARVTARNFQGNFVLTAPVSDIPEIQQCLLERGVLCQKLPVNYGFHTDLMDALEPEFRKMFRGLVIGPGGVPIVSAFQKSVIDEVSEDLLWKVSRYPVEFGETIRTMLESGDYTFIDVGPSGSLATSVKYLLPPGSGSVFLEIMNQYGKDLDSMDRFRRNMGM